MSTQNTSVATTGNDTITIPASSYSALLFDMDGTIIDNMGIHHEAWRDMLKTLGHDWSIQEVRERIWGKNEEIFERLFPQQYSLEQARQLAVQKEKMYIERYRPHIALLPGLEKLLTEAKCAGLSLGIVTAAPRMNVDFAYDALKLERFFDLVVHADEISRGKPDPEGYLVAASRLSVDTSRCLVFEDAPVGVRAAEAAGMDSYVVLTTHSAEEFSGFSTVKGFVADFSPFAV
jgi:beta-phosphoglucomutase family hydrolase